jgi:hypothetical protein
MLFGISLWHLGVVFQVLMIIHFFRTRPEYYWFFVILFLGPLGSLAYFVIEVVPGLRAELPVIDRFKRKRRQQWLEGMVAETPTQEACSDLAKIYAGGRRHQEAIGLFTRALALDPEDPDCLHGRGSCYAATGDKQKAAADFEAVIAIDPSHAFHAAHVELAETYAALGRTDDSAAAYEAILGRTTISRAYYGYGKLLAERGEKDRARKMLREILAKQAALPRYLRRQERPWLRRAKALLKEHG